MLLQGYFIGLATGVIISWISFYFAYLMNKPQPQKERKR